MNREVGECDFGLIGYGEILCFLEVCCTFQLDVHLYRSMLHLSTSAYLVSRPTQIHPLFCSYQNLLKYFMIIITLFLMIIYGGECKI